MKKLILTLLIATASVGAAQAQDYNWAVGLRMGGDTGGLSVKHRFNHAAALEGIASAFWDNGLMVTLLYERYIPVIGQGWNIYYGGGAHVGGIKKYTIAGVDGIAGVEYMFQRAPVALSLDWKPALDIIEDTDLRLGDFALGVRVTF